MQLLLLVHDLPPCHLLSRERSPGKREYERDDHDQPAQDRYLHIFHKNPPNFYKIEQPKRDKSEIETTGRFSSIFPKMSSVPPRKAPRPLRSSRRRKIYG